MTTNEERIFNEYGRNHHIQFYIDFKNTQRQEGDVLLSIYTNAEGTVFAKDNQGNDIENRLVKYTIYNNRYIYPGTNAYVDGKLTVKFLDGSSFSKTDAIDENSVVYWYSIPTLVPFAIKPFT